MGNPLHQFHIPGVEAPTIDQMTTTLTLPVVILDPAQQGVMNYEAIRQMRRYGTMVDWSRRDGRPENFDLDGMSGIRQSSRVAAYSGQTVLRPAGAEAPMPGRNNPHRPASHRAPSTWPRIRFTRRPSAHAQ